MIAEGFGSNRAKAFFTVKNSTMVPIETELRTDLFQGNVMITAKELSEAVSYRRRRAERMAYREEREAYKGKQKSYRFGGREEQGSP